MKTDALIPAQKCVVKLATAITVTTAITVEPTWTSSVAYHELADVPVQQIDLFDSVEQNLNHLEDLQARLRFMMKEVKYLLKL